MRPYIQLLHLHIPVYPLLGLLGCACAGLYVFFVKWRGRLGRLPGKDLIHIGALGGVGAMLGAKLLYLLTIIPVLVKNWDLLMQDTNLLLQLLLNGMVFYGGLFGGILTAFLYCHKYAIPFETLAAIATPAIPLFHTFGRIGCFFAGCCWGIEIPWGIPFQHSLGAPNGIPLLPIQLVEAGGNLLLFFALAALSHLLRRKWLVLPIYIASYACMRFVLEFFRGDLIRGVFLLSTSQWIALASLLAVVMYFLLRSRRKI